jgi:hypothetical protein
MEKPFLKTSMVVVRMGLDSPVSWSWSWRSGAAASLSPRLPLIDVDEILMLWWLLGAQPT